MKVISRWKVRPGSMHEVARRYATGAGGNVAGAELVHRWMRVDMSEGISVYEVSDPAILFSALAMWADVMESEAFPVLDEKEAAPILLKLFKP